MFGRPKMILSHERQFVILAPWKTASSTLRLRLAKFNDSPYSPFYEFNRHLQRIVTQHLTYPDFLMLPESRLGYLVGVFVRNPYDRVYSGFLQLQRDIREQPSAAFPSSWVKRLVMRQLADNFVQLAAGEFDFNKWLAQVEEYQIYEVGRNSSFPLHPVHYWSGIRMEQKVDFIGKVERFENDLRSFLQRAGITSVERLNANISNLSAASCCTQTGSRYLHLMTPASIDKINQLFREDFELFDYKRSRC
jgi:hypothetical protein